MTLPVSLPLSMSQVKTELGVSGSLSMSNDNLRRMAGKLKAGFGPCSLSDLLGKTSFGFGFITVANIGGTYGYNDNVITGGVQGVMTYTPGNQFPTAGKIKGVLANPGSNTMTFVTTGPDAFSGNFILEILNADFSVRNTAIVAYDGFDGTNNSYIVTGAANLIVGSGDVGATLPLNIRV